MGVFCCSAMNVGRMADGRTVRVRRRCVEEGLEEALNRKEQLNRRAKVSGWEGGSSAGGGRLRRWPSPGGICAVVAALARGLLGGVRDRGWRESGDGSSYAKKKRP